MKLGLVFSSALVVAGCSGAAAPAPVAATKLTAASPAKAPAAPAATATATMPVTALPATKTVQVGVGEEVLGDLALPLLAEAPVDAEPARGLAGFFTQDGSVDVMIREVGPREAKTLDEDVKGSTPYTLRWLTKERTADGWVIVNVAPGFDDKFERNGDVYTFDVRRTIAGKQYTCYGGVKSQAQVEPNLKICRSLRAK